MKKTFLSFALFFAVSNVFSQATWKDVAPIFYARCTSCHNLYSHGPSWLNYTSTSLYVLSIQSKLSSDQMPPWPPDTTYTRFTNEHHIMPSEKAAILNWISNGALKGDTTQAPPAPVYGKYKLVGEMPEVVLQIPNFTSNASSADSYVCFSLPTGLTQDRILKAYEIVPGNPKIVHHVVVKVDTTGATTDNLSGTCYNQPGHFELGGWAPGSPPTVFPSKAPLKAGIRIKAGSKIVLQIHYPVGSQGKVDSTQIRLFFYPTNATGVRTMYVSTPLQNWSLSIPANTVKMYTATYPSTGLTNTISAFAIFPHSHKIATKITDMAYKTTDTIPLIRINKWDFNWQGFYTFRKLIQLNTGYRLFTRHLYDNTTANPNNPNPVNVIAGFNTSDEMLFDGFQWLNYQAGDENINIDSLLKNDSLYIFSGIKENGSLAKGNFRSYAFPNPFDNSVRIGYVLDNAAQVNIEVRNMYGQIVRVLNGAFESNGVHEMVWDGKNSGGVNLPDGTYFYTVKAGTMQSHGKLNMVK